MLSADGLDVKAEVYFAQKVVLERIRQDRKWGPSAGREVPPLRILIEEVGEVAEAMNRNEPPDIFEELVHVAAVASAMAEGILRGDVPR